MLFLSKLNFDKVKKEGAVGIIFTENVILLDSRTAEQLTSKSFVNNLMENHQLDINNIYSGETVLG